MHEFELDRLVKIAKVAVANSERPLMGGVSRDFIAGAVMQVAMKQRREDETPEGVFARVTLEDHDARILMKARHLTAAPLAKMSPATTEIEGAQRQLDAMIARHRLKAGGAYEAAFELLTRDGEGKTLLRTIRGK